MLHFALSTIIFLFWSSAIVWIYYSDFFSKIDHSVSTSGYQEYITGIIVFYLLYKILTLFIGWDKLKFKLHTILGIVLAHILFVCIVYASLPSSTNSIFFVGKSISGITLFFHVCTLLIYPLVLILITRSVGYSLLRFAIEDWKSLDLRLRFPTEVTIGFIVFILLLLVIGSFSIFTLPGLVGVLIFMIIIGIPGLKESYFDVKGRSIEIENHSDRHGYTSLINLKLLSIEFGFLFLTFVLAVSLINVIRPMPIGWDDLGVYMNYPKMMASMGTLLQGSGMYAWQLVTSTGYLFDQVAAQAFYLNQLGGILAVIAIISTLSYAFEKKGTIALISLPILFAAVYYSMPMTVFQQAKDMKIDPAYLFFCISGIMLLFHSWGSHENTQKKDYTLLLLIGVIIGFTFTVKFTSVMLILGCLGVVAYRYLSFSGYIGFFFLFLAVFTQFDLWKMINIPMPRDNNELMSGISLTFYICAFICIGIPFLREKFHSKEKIGGYQNAYLKTRNWVISSSILLIGFGLAVSPWMVKHIHEIGVSNIKNTSIITAVLNGSGGTANYDFGVLYSPEELKMIQENSIQGITEDGKSENEDMGRYFGYESGINNYLKLPANLTFQKNQPGEFTDITYIFLALLPGLILFTQGKRTYSMVMIGSIFIAFMTLYYFHEPSRLALEAIFGKFTLIIDPKKWETYGYALLLLLNFLIVGLFHFFTAPTEENKKLREVIMFMGLYSFIFLIAAFGIVWYGIVIYFGYFLIMGYAVLHRISLENKGNEDEDQKMASFTLAVLILFFISMYFVRSGFPNSWNNLLNASYNEYKFHLMTQEESIFAYRPEYLLPIATLNLQDISKIYEGTQGQMQSNTMKNFFKENSLQDLPLEAVNATINTSRISRDTAQSKEDIALKNDLRLLGKHIYSQVLYPPSDNTNTGGIYRIGTFMTYLINQNRKRYLDDSLLIYFGDYFYDPSPEKTIDRMKKLGLKYLLVDLNSATIDKDERRALTTRAENLLMTMNAENLRLVSTDNFCLKIALSERKKGKFQTREEFLDVAATNFESYRNGETIYRNMKLMNCHRYLIDLINQNPKTEYPEVESLRAELMGLPDKTDGEKISSILYKYAGQSFFALFEIIDTPVGTSPSAGTGSTQSGTGVVSPGTTR